MAMTIPHSVEPILLVLFAHKVYKNMAKLSVAAIPCLLVVVLLSGSAHGRSWTDIAPLHGLSQPDLSSMGLMVESNPLFLSDPTASPTTAAPSRLASEAPSFQPTLVPTDTPTSAPSLAPDLFPPNDAPRNPDSSYFNYDDTPGESHGPGYLGFKNINNQMVLGYKENAWAQVKSPSDSYWNEFDGNGFGPWKGTLENRQPNRNMCGRVGMQSPINVKDSGATCDEFHEVRSLVSQDSVPAVIRNTFVMRSSTHSLSPLQLYL